MAFIVFLYLFGLWWLLFPRSVIRFYRWFHGTTGIFRFRGSDNPTTVRLTGLGMIVLLTGLAVFARR